jgi:putative SOS response-associated peptidase YedK
MVGYSVGYMCGRFARKSTQEILAEWFGLDLEEMPWFAPTYNAAPQSIQPVIRLNHDSGRREAVLMRWGLVPFWARDTKIGLSTINARAEEAAAKPAYREALKKRRCLVPADAYYEWQRLGDKTKRPFAIALQSGDPYAFAGLWESWQPPQGALLETFTILTTAPNSLTEPIHDRMPVIVVPKDYERWTDPSTAPPLDLLRPYPANHMRAWPVGEQLGNVRNNAPGLLDEVQENQQSLYS